MTEDEFKSGVMADGTRVGAKSNFIEDAMRTCSPNFYSERVSAAEFMKAVNDCIEAGNRLDKVKKSLFYGRDNNLEARLGERTAGVIVVGLTDSLSRSPVETSPSAIAVDLIHGIIGKVTEAGELLEALREGYRGNGIDMVNINEEIGDGFWYDAILLNRTGGTFEGVQATIIAKLRARFPEAYADASANERDLTAERTILEGGTRVDLSLEPEGFGVDEYADGDIAILPIAPAIPASGPSAVAEADAKAKAAFAAVNSVGKSPEAVEPPVDPELAKGIGERLAPMPGEKLAQENNPK